MSTTDTTTTAANAVTLPWVLRRSVVLMWGQLPTALGVGAVGLASLVPLIIAAATRQGVVAAICLILPALYLTGAARFAAELVAGDKPRVRSALGFDPVLAVSIAVPAAVAVLLIGGDLAVVGYALAALLALTVPFVLGYSVARDRRGVIAWRGGLILVAYRPGWALTLLALTVIGAFAVVASAGALAIVFLPLVTLEGVALCALLLEDIDSRTHA